MFDLTHQYFYFVGFSFSFYSQFRISLLALPYSLITSPCCLLGTSFLFLALFGHLNLSGLIHIPFLPNSFSCKNPAKSSFPPLELLWFLQVIFGIFVQNLTGPSCFPWLLSILNSFLIIFWCLTRSSFIYCLYRTDRHE